MVAVLSRGAVAMALGLSLILGSMGAGSSASAEGPASVFYGYVSADVHGMLPDRVQALGPAGAVCGSGDVVNISDTTGFYALPVVSADLKAGCPAIGGVVQFSLVSGRVDDGVWAEQVATLAPRMTPESLNLNAAPSIIPYWLGIPGNVDGGGSLLRWTGESTSLSVALATLPFRVDAVYRLDASGTFVAVAPSGGPVLEPGDLLLVHSR